jgi:predicted ATP-dependent serine protease
VSQVREVAGALIKVAKERGIATVLVGHVTKDGSIAGPRVLEHLVDVVLQFEGDRHSRLRPASTWAMTASRGCPTPQVSSSRDMRSRCPEAA